MRIGIAAVAMIAASGFAFGQHQHEQSPYAGLQQRTVKALSDQQIGDLRAGRGMGLALAAELNGYPGPMHVLELAKELGLSAEQHRRVSELVDQMKAEAIPAGGRLIEQEKELDQAFAQRQITPVALATLAARIGEAQGELRAIHLKYHLTTAELLTGQQRDRYAGLRGYR